MAVVNRSAKRFTWVKGRVYPVVVGVDLACFQTKNTVVVRLCPILEGTVWTEVMSTLHVAMYLFSKIADDVKMWKENKSGTRGAASLMSLSHYDVFCGLLLYRLTPTRNQIHLIYLMKTQNVVCPLRVHKKDSIKKRELFSLSDS